MLSNLTDQWKYLCSKNDSLTCSTIHDLIMNNCISTPHSCEHLVKLYLCWPEKKKEYRNSLLIEIKFTHTKLSLNSWKKKPGRPFQVRIISLQMSWEAFEVSCSHPSALLSGHQSEAAPLSSSWHCIKQCAYCRMYCEHKSSSLASSYLLEHSLNFTEQGSMRLFFFPVHMAI